MSKKVPVLDCGAEGAPASQRPDQADREGQPERLDGLHPWVMEDLA